MTLQASGAITMAQINAEFGRGNNLNAYRGASYWLDSVASPYTFASTPLSFSDFYSKRGSSPVSAGSQTFTGSGTFTVPLFNTLTVYADGKTGATGFGCSVGYGGVGGRAVSVYTAGQLTVGANISVTVNDSQSSFGSVIGYAGGPGYGGEMVNVGSEGDQVCSGALNGSQGTASGGSSSNTTGGSGAAGGQVYVVWS
jgi:hypothetical protein